MPQTMGLDGPSSDSSTSSTTTPPEQPAETPMEEPPAPTGEKQQVTVTIKNPNEELLKKGVTTVKPTVIKKP
jgi:hypothetical protein